MTQAKSSIAPRVKEIADKLNEAGVPPAYDAEHSRLLLGVWREIARGTPVEEQTVDAIIADVGIEATEARNFLGDVSEKDEDGRIVGAVGLSQNQHPHRFTVDGIQLATWCAWDSLFVPPGLQKPAIVESVSPISQKEIRVEVSPTGVDAVSPTDAAVTIVVLEEAISSVEEAWMVFCHQVLFFASKAEAEEWSAERTGIEVLSVADAFDLGRAAFEGVFKYV